MKTWNILYDACDKVINVLIKADNVINVNNEDYEFIIHDGSEDKYDLVAIIPTFRCLAIVEKKYLENTRVIDSLSFSGEDKI